MCDQPVSRDGAVIRESTISHLESRDFFFQRLHLEFTCELAGSISSVLTKLSPSFSTGKDCFYRHSRGNFNRKSYFLFIFNLVMFEDMVTITSLHKQNLSRTDAYFRRCRHYIAAGHKPVCLVGCRVCDGSRRFNELLKFYSLRDSSSRPERK